MKKIEELGISPAPWELDDQHDGYISDKIGYAVASADGDCTRNMIANARLIAAAPDIYEALHEAVEEKCTECHEINDYESDIGVEWQMCKRCPVKKWRDALASAAGESEVKK